MLAAQASRIAEEICVSISLTGRKRARRVERRAVGQGMHSLQDGFWFVGRGTFAAHSHRKNRRFKGTPARPGVHACADPERYDKKKKKLAVPPDPFVALAPKRNAP